MKLVVLFFILKIILSNNLRYVLNRFILWNKKFYNSTDKNDLLIKANFYDDIDGALRDLAPFVQFEKREKHLWKSTNFSKVASFTKMKK